MITKQYNHWTTDMDRTTASMQSIVNRLQLDGMVISLEHGENEAYRWLDKISGIDWLYKTNDDHVSGIAVRIQFVDPDAQPYNTFTVRFARHTGNATEYEKRKESIDNGCLNPTYTIQAYVNQNDPTEVISAAIVKTNDLYAYCDQYQNEISENVSDNVFKIMKWDLIKQHGYNITSSTKPYTSSYDRICNEFLNRNN